MRVIVPFQRQIQTGYVVSLETETDFDKTRSIQALLDEKPVIQPDMMNVCEWIAQYYCCSLGEALHGTIPSGIAVRTSKKFALLTNNITAEIGRASSRARG